MTGRSVNETPPRVNDLVHRRIPYELSGRDPARGLDCWGLCLWAAQEVLGGPISDPWADVAQAVSVGLDPEELPPPAGWRVLPVAAALQPCDLLFGTWHNQDRHCWIVGEDGRALTTFEATGLVLQRLGLILPRVSCRFRVRPCPGVEESVPSARDLFHRHGGRA